MTKREVPRVIAIDGPAGSGKSTVARAVPTGLNSNTWIPERCTGASLMQCFSGESTRLTGQR